MSLFARHSPDPLANPAPLVKRVYSYVAYRLGDGPEAEDVTSEVFERAIRYRSTFDPERGEPIAWLLGIASRCVHSARARSIETVEEAAEQAADVDLEGETLRRLTLAEAVAALQVREQEMIALRYGADLTAAQIATLLEMKTNAVEVALHRALARLRSLLGEAEDDHDAVRVLPPAPVSDVEAGATGGGV